MDNVVFVLEVIIGFVLGGLAIHLQTIVIHRKYSPNEKFSILYNFIPLLPTQQNVAVSVVVSAVLFITLFLFTSNPLLVTFSIVYTIY
ncbi:MAG: hypothetical protein GXO26_01660, partial [Crenarchaeota archaeon]|nr:hypothetical protein [Thermoproteota archaeon]